MTLTTETMSPLELAWTIPAALAFLITLVALGWVLVTFRSLSRQIAADPDKYRAWGPRWNFLLFLGSSLVFFGGGWLGYLWIGVLALMIPEPIRPENQDAMDLLAYILICMEITHALAQALLVGGLFALAGKWNRPFEFWRPRI